MIDVPLSIAEAAAALREGRVTSRALAEAVIERADRLDERLGTFLHRTTREAFEAAERADRELAAGHDRGPLHGIPLGVKDILATSDAPTTGQSLAFERAWGEQGDGPAVARLRAAGAVLVGKTTTMELAIGFPDPEKPFPIPRNPWNLETWAGGSSSGTANGVAAGLFLGGLGTDTGGSIRMPAALCGITGLKPTYGHVPKSGCIPLSWSFDHVGPMARSAGDTALMLDVLAGGHTSDPRSLDAPVAQYTSGLDGNASGLRIGVDRALHERTIGVEPQAVERLEEALAVLREAGATVTEVVIPRYEALADACIITFLSEGFAYHRERLRDRWFDFGRSTRFMLAVGALYTATDFIQAQRLLRIGGGEIRALLGDVDLVAMPTVGCGAPLLEGLDFASALSLPLFTPVWSGLGLPAISIPMGFTPKELPLGLQLVAAPLREPTLLRAADAYQQRTSWHRRVPPLVGAS